MPTYHLGDQGQLARVGAHGYLAQAEQELQRLRQRQLDETQQLWARYQPGYEHYLHAAPDPEPEEEAEAEAEVEGEPEVEAADADETSKVTS